MFKHIKLIIGSITAGVAALGVIKSLLEASLGGEFSLQQVGFYMGAAAFLLWIAIFVAGLVAGVIMAIIGWLTKDPSDSVVLVIFAIGAVAGVTLALQVLFAGYLFDYEGTDDFGRAGIAIVGLIAVVAGAYFFVKAKNKEPEPKP